MLLCASRELKLETTYQSLAGAKVSEKFGEERTIGIETSVRVYRLFSINKSEKRQKSRIQLKFFLPS